VLANAPTHEGAELLQHRVARDVPVGVVDALEVIDVEHDERQLAPVPLGPGDLAREGLVEGALVARLRERVAHHEAVDLLVVAGLHVVAGHVLQDGAPDLDLRAVGQLHLADGRVVDERPVRGPEVLHVAAAGAKEEPRVLSADAVLGQEQVDGLYPADDERLTPKLDALAHVGAVEHHEERGALRQVGDGGAPRVAGRLHRRVLLAHGPHDSRGEGDALASRRRLNRYFFQRDTRPLGHA